MSILRHLIDRPIQFYRYIKGIVIKPPYHPYNDVLTREAIKLAQDNKKVSKAILQRYFNIGTNRSLALMEELKRLEIIDDKGIFKDSLKH